MEIVTQPLHLQLAGLSSTAINKDYAGTAFKLSGRLWEILRSNALKNKGKNIWVYEEAHQVFAGVELEEEYDLKALGLESKEIYLERYAYHKHVGPYSLIKVAGAEMQKQLTEKGITVQLPYIEIYGHWNKDESKLETELIHQLK